MSKNDNKDSITSYGNGFNLVSLNKLSRGERALTIAVVNQFVKTDNRTITVTFDELLEFQGKRVSYNNLDRMLDNVLGTKAAIVTSDEKFFINLFSMAGINEEERTMRLTISYDIQALLLNQKSGYTTLEMTEWIELKSSYSQELYRKLRQYRHTGMYRVRSEELLGFLNVPSSYTPSMFNHRILIPAMKELSVMFEGLNVETENEKRGKFPTSYTFTFKKHIRRDRNNMIAREEELTDKELIDLIYKNTNNDK